MRRVLEDKRLSGVEVKDGHSTSIPLPDESVDAVVIAQVGQVTIRHRFGAKRLSW